jgi:ankyrin repeat protein
MKILKGPSDIETDIVFNEMRQTDALWWSITNNLPEYVKKSIESGANINNCRDYNTPLTKAIYNSRLDIVKILVEAGVNINKKNTDGNTALMCATRINNLEIVKYLVEAGAEINIVSKYNNAINVAINNNYLEIVKYLVEHGADINLKNENDGRDAILNASSNGNLKMVKYLVEQGANVNVRDKYNYTPLIAAASTNLNLVRYLIEQGADPSVINNFHATAFLEAIAYDKLDIVKYLYENTKVDLKRNEKHSMSIDNIKLIQYLIYINFQFFYSDIVWDKLLSNSKIEKTPNEILKFILTPKQKS